MKEWYRKLPKMDACLEDERAKAWIEIYGYEQVKSGFSAGLAHIRGMIPSFQKEEELEGWIDGLFDWVQTHLQSRIQGLVPVVNATGTLLHTNLGRANFSPELAARAVKKAGRYSNLEYRLEEGKRGSRYDHIEGLLCMLTGAEAAMAVNNNAAAVMLMLAALAQEREVVVSRGELVEIGGSFRIPEVMKLSGAKLKEVGTTNRTRISDYKEASNAETGAYLKVHTSNYQILGFTESTSIKEMVALSKETGIPVLEDQGSGVLTDLSAYGLPKETTVQASIAAGVDLVTFSGDKLLGGPQAGFLVGRRDLIDRCKNHQLNRALRVDKITLALAEETLRLYLNQSRISEIPFYWMMERTADELKRAAKEVMKRVDQSQCSSLGLEIRESEGTVGGGSLPGVSFSSIALVLANGNAAKLERQLRMRKHPIVARVQQDVVWLDLRTIYPDQWSEVADALNELEAEE